MDSYKDRTLRNLVSSRRRIVPRLCRSVGRCADEERRWFDGRGRVAGEVLPNDETVGPSMWTTRSIFVRSHRCLLIYAIHGLWQLLGALFSTRSDSDMPDADPNLRTKSKTNIRQPAKFKRRFPPSGEGFPRCGIKPLAFVSTVNDSRKCAEFRAGL